jgi:hypothetical protein
MTEAIHERAISKAFAKVMTLKMDIRSLADDIKWKRTGGVTVDELKSVLEGTKNELETWKYIYNLIEKNER